MKELLMNHVIVEASVTNSGIGYPSQDIFHSLIGCHCL